MKKLIRITTVPSSLRSLLKGQHRFMNSHYKVIGVSSAGDALGEVSQNEGINTHAIEMTRSITPLKDLKSLYQLYTFFKQEKPFIVHTHTPKAGTLGMLAAKLAGVPHRLHTVAGLPLLETTGIKRKLLDIVEKATYACSTGVLPNSLGLKKIILEQQYTSFEKIKIIANGSSNGINVTHYDSSLVTETTKTQLKTDLGITENDTVFIFIGRLVKDKGINELVAAFNKLSQQNNHVKLLLIGHKDSQLNPIHTSTQTLISQNQHILELGVQYDIRPYVAIAHILTFPSYREGFPNVVLQASCMNLPCIVSDINGCNEIITHNKNGIIIPPKNTQALTNAMTYLLKMPEIRLKMTQHARANIIKNYEQKHVWEALLTHYNTLK